MNQSEISIKDLHKRYRDVVAVAELSIDVQKGEFFSILGPSGSGKTTALRLIAGLEVPDRGEIFIQGRSMTGVPPQRRPVNTVFQHYALFPHMTVWKNIAFGLEMQKLRSSEITTRVGAMIEMIRLHGKEQRLPGQLSGGEQQRVALARALVNRPSVLLLDEPLGALDHHLRLDMQHELKRIQSESGITFVCVTHHQEEALTMSDRVAVMNHGRLIQVGPPTDVYEWPNSTFVAGFLGITNRLHGEITSIVDSHAIVSNHAVQALRVAVTPESMVGDKVIFFIKPERIRLSRYQQLLGHDNSIPVVVQTASSIGGDMVYQVAIAPDISWEVRECLTSRAQDRFHPGEHLVLHWPSQEGLLLTH